MMILPFKKAAPPGWRPDELAECFRVVDLLIRAGLPVSIQTGVSDEGDPWGAVVRDDTGDMLLHLARTDGQFLVASAAGNPVQRGRDLREVINAAFSQGDLALASRRAQLRDGDILRLHPSALMAAVIVTAWLHTEAERDISVANRADRSEQGGGSTGAVRLGSDAAHTPHLTMVMKAAVSFAAVVAALETSSRDWMPLKLDIDALVTLAAAPQLILSGGSSLSDAGMEADAGTRAPVNFDALETIMADVPAHVPSGREASAEVPLANTTLPAILTVASGNTFPNVIAPSASYATSAVTSWPTSGLDLPFLTPSFADRTVAFTLPTADDGESFVEAAPRGSITPSLNHAEPQNSAPTSLTAPAPSTATIPQATGVSASIPAGTPDPVAYTMRQTAPAETSMRQAGAENATLSDTKPLVGLENGPFFRSALQLLHLDQSFQMDVRPVGTGSFLSLSKGDVITGLDKPEHSRAHETTDMSLEVVSTSALPEPLSTATTIAGVTSNLAPSLTPTSLKLNAVMSGAVPSTGLPTAPLLDQPTISTALPTAVVPMVTVAPPAPSMPNNTQMLLNFAGNAANATKVSAEAWAAIIAAERDTAGASSILVFDAPWLSGKAFMLMPGMVMVEDDLLTGSARVVLPPIAPVTLDLGDGLSVQLLGILTV